MAPNRPVNLLDHSEQQRLVELLLSSGSLRLGAFKTKTGRISPYFFNVGCIASGPDLASLCHLYGGVIKKLWPTVDCLFGSAYKGIPLVAALSVTLCSSIKDLKFAYNRKEAKNHGEGGSLVGAPLGPNTRVVIIDDVLTGGVSLEEAVHLIRSTGANVLGAVVAIDRQEKAHASPKSAKTWVEESLEVSVASLITVDEIIAILERDTILGRHWMTPELRTQIAAYRKEFGSA